MGQEEKKTEIVEFNTAESWEIARNYASLLGEVPNSFSVLTRALMSDHAKGTGSLSSSSNYQLMRLLKSDGLRLCMYNAALTFSDGELEPYNAITPAKIVNPFRPFELAVLISLIYFFRKARKVVPEDEWGYIKDPMQIAVDLCGMIGVVMENVGGRGLLVGGMPYLGHACFSKHKKKEFTEYRRTMKNTRVKYDPLYEHKVFGCTSIQVGSILIQSVGIGIPIAESFTQGLTPGTRVENKEDLNAYAFYVTQVWMKSLLEDGKIPDISHDGRFYPVSDALETLEATAQELNDTGLRYRWLETKKKESRQEDTAEEENVAEA